MLVLNKFLDWLAFEDHFSDNPCRLLFIYFVVAASIKHELLVVTYEVGCVCFSTKLFGQCGLKSLQFFWVIYVLSIIKAM